MLMVWPFQPTWSSLRLGGAANIITNDAYDTYVRTYDLGTSLKADKTRGRGRQIRKKGRRTPNTIIQHTAGTKTPNTERAVCVACYR